jgi:hypothetical protein
VPPAFSTASTADFDAPVTESLSLDGELALGEHPDAVELAAHEAGGHERVLGDLGLGVELAWRRRTSG